MFFEDAKARHVASAPAHGGPLLKQAHRIVIGPHGVVSNAQGVRHGAVGVHLETRFGQRRHECDCHIGVGLAPTAPGIDDGRHVARLGGADRHGLARRGGYLRHRRPPTAGGAGRPRFRRGSVYLKAYHLSNTQMGTFGSIFGIFGMVSYLFGGVIADMITTRKLMSISLILTGIGGFLHLANPNYAMLLAIYALWSFTSL